MEENKILKILNQNIDSNYLIQLINILYKPVLIIFLIILIYKVIKFFYKKIKEKKYQKKLSSSGIKDIDNMEGLQFEFYLKALLKELGFKSEVTKGSNDFGADLIMKKNQQKIVIQAKRYKYKNNVGINAIQQIYSAIPFYKANEGWVITNSFYTKSAKKLANVCNIKLINRYELIDFINEINPDITPKEVKNIIKPKPRKCPTCKNELIIRKNKLNDEFFGCSNYPNCKHTESIAK